MYPYFIALVGVAIFTITTAYSVVRGMLIRETFRAGFAGRQAVNAGAFGLTSDVTILAVVIAIAGLVWLGLTLRSSHTNANQ